MKDLVSGGRVQPLAAPLPICSSSAMLCTFSCHHQGLLVELVSCMSVVRVLSGGFVTDISSTFNLSA